MAGLFWVDGNGCLLGAPPLKDGTGVRLSDEGLEVFGTETGAWSWEQVERVTVADAPVRSALRRALSTAFSFAATAAGFGGPEEPPLMTVRVTLPEGERAYEVPSAAWPAYTEREVALSHRLMDRFTAGAARPSLLTGWWRASDCPVALRPGEREALLEELLERWAGR